MTSPEDGDYVIYNRVLGYNGDRLAMTFAGSGEEVTMQPLDKSSNQVVRIYLPQQIPFSLTIDLVDLKEIQRYSFYRQP